MGRRRFPGIVLNAATAASLALGILLGGCAGNCVVHQLELNGAALSKPLPEVTVFVPRTRDRREETFGDSNLRAIAPILDAIHRFSCLDLSRTGVTDAGMESLTASEELRSLDISSTAVTARGLVKLSGCPNLKWILVSRKQVNDTDLEMLQASMGGISVIRDSR